ncbi:hypothetical protein MSPP1_002676 [Malassezia sp. CBS 17886]|nr:hypothetical protein MSPP1_002676 [Malassezia sp. CBS 17886]
MGAAESRPNGEPIAPKRGFHVIRVARGSPAQQAGFEPFFDFCVGLNGVPVVDLGVDYVSGPANKRLAQWDAVEASEGRELVVNVWSAKLQAFRETRPSLLGLTLRNCSPTAATSHVWHILDVLAGSPADSGGLVPFGDYIIGWTGGPLHSENDFYQLIEQHENRHVALYVYNSDYDHTREVIIVPNRSWGGDGLLGCGVGYGLLHRIPKPGKTWGDDGSGVGAEDVAYADTAPTDMEAAEYDQSYNYANSDTTVHELGNAQGVTLRVHEEEEE